MPKQGAPSASKQERPKRWICSILKTLSGTASQETSGSSTQSTILQGELEVIDYKDGKEVGRKIRRAGDYSHGAPGHVHMEKAGPEGALVIFHLYSPDGALVEQLAPDGSVIRTTHLSDFQSDRW
ncbi:MAG: hypothetical protein ACE37M_17000 [Henriciella sp.]